MQLLKRYKIPLKIVSVYPFSECCHRRILFDGCCLCKSKYHNQKDDCQCGRKGIKQISRSVYISPDHRPDQHVYKWSYGNCQSTSQNGSESARDHILIYIGKGNLSRSIPKRFQHSDTLHLILDIAGYFMTYRKERCNQSYKRQKYQHKHKHFKKCSFIDFFRAVFVITGLIAYVFERNFIASFQKILIIKVGCSVKKQTLIFTIALIVLKELCEQLIISIRKNNLITMSIRTVKSRLIETDYGKGILTAIFEDDKIISQLKTLDDLKGNRQPDRMLKFSYLLFRHTVQLFERFHLALCFFSYKHIVISNRIPLLCYRIYQRIVYQFSLGNLIDPVFFFQDISELIAVLICRDHNTVRIAS